MAGSSGEQWFTHTPADPTFWLEISAIAPPMSEPLLTAPADRFTGGPGAPDAGTVGPITDALRKVSVSKMRQPISI